MWAEGEQVLSGVLWWLQAHYPDVYTLHGMPPGDPPGGLEHRVMECALTWSQGLERSYAALVAEAVRSHGRQLLGWGYLELYRVSDHDDLLLLRWQCYVVPSHFIPHPPRHQVLSQRLLSEYPDQWSEEFAVP